MRALVYIVMLITLCMQLSSVHANDSVNPNKHNFVATLNDAAYSNKPTLNYSYQVVVEKIKIRVTSTKDRVVGKKKIAGRYVVSVGNKKFVNPQQFKPFEVGSIKFKRFTYNWFGIINRRQETAYIGVQSTVAHMKQSNGIIGGKPVTYEHRNADSIESHNYFFFKNTKAHLYVIYETLQNKPKGPPTLFEACVSSFTSLKNSLIQ
jgi:hypothetical protein